MKKLAVSVFAAAIGVLALTLSAAACQFSFNYSEITAPLGTVGEIGVRVQKDHNNCTLTSMDDYQFAWEDIQVLGQTAWAEIGPNLYEKWFQVSLSEVGDGYLMISKDCTKEGYEEAVLPIAVLDPTADSLWQQATDGAYPLDELEEGTLENVVGDGIVSEEILTIGEFFIDLPSVPVRFDGEMGPVRVFFMTISEGTRIPLLIVSDGFFLRFDDQVPDGI